MIPWSEREGANGCSYGSGNRGIIIFVIQLSICGAGSIPAWGIFLFIANAKVQQFVCTVAVTELRGSPEVKRRKARSVLGWGSTQGWPCRSGCTQTGPRRDWLHTGITQTAPGGIGCTRESHRRAPGGIGCTRELQRGGPGGIGCTQGVHLYFETSPDHAVRSDQMAVSLKISFGKQKKEQFLILQYPVPYFTVTNHGHHKNALH